MIKSDSIGQLAKALSAAQGEMHGAKKDSQNPFFKSTYSDLESVIEAIKGPFTKNGLCFTQTTDSNSNGEIAVGTLIIHASGEFIGSTLSAKPLDNKPQTIGSLITYLKRYGLQALAGVPSIDDDGEAAQGRSKITEPVRPQVVMTKKIKEAFPSAKLEKTEYVVPFGKYKDLTLKEIPVEDLYVYVDFIKSDAQKKNKEITGVIAEFIEQVKNLDGNIK